MTEIAKVFYSCPECSRVLHRTVQYMEPSLFKDKQAVQTHSFWCPRCDARQMVSFVLVKHDLGFKITTIKITSNDKVVNRKLKLKK